MGLIAVIRQLRRTTRAKIRLKVRLKLHDIALRTFWFPAPVSGPTVRTFRPDSFSIYNLHPEYRKLYRQFTAHNLGNRGDTGRLTAFILNIKQVLDEGIEGEFAELGVWRGNTASILAHYAVRARRRLVLFDTFEGFSDKDLNGVDFNKGLQFQDTSISMVASVVGEEVGIEYVRGYFPATITASLSQRSYAVVSLDCDLYAPMKAGLEFFYPRMKPGAIFLLHDYSSGCWDGAKRAVDEFCVANDEYLVLIPDKSGSAFLRKSRRNLSV